MQGVDFYFSNRAHATKFVDFLSNVVPVRYRNDKQLVSHNTHTSTYNYKYTYSVEIAPICRVQTFPIATSYPEVSIYRLRLGKCDVWLVKQFIG